MDTDNFEIYVKELIDQIVSFHRSITEKVDADIETHELKSVLPNTPPEEPEEWSKIVENVSRRILKYNIAAHQKHNYAFPPNGGSYSSLMGNMISNAIGMVPYNVVNENMSLDLETIMMDWLARAMELPIDFLSTGMGGGKLQSSRKECVLNCLIAAKINKMKECDESTPKHEYLSKFVAYCSVESYSAFQSVAKMAMVNVKILQSDENYSLRGNIVQTAIDEDIEIGLIPLFLYSNLGCLINTSIDNLKEIGPYCRNNNIWLHVDGAYGGISLMCSEMRQYAEGFEFVDSFNTNADMWFLVNADCACLWVNDMEKMKEAFSDTSEMYPMQHFKSMQIWLTLRAYGLNGVQKHVRTHITLAHILEGLLLETGLFQIMNNVVYGLVCFRLKHTNNDTNQQLFDLLRDSNSINLGSMWLRGKFVLKFWVSGTAIKESDIQEAFELIQQLTNKLINEINDGVCTCEPE